MTLLPLLGYLSLPFINNSPLACKTISSLNFFCRGRYELLNSFQNVLDATVSAVTPTPFRALRAAGLVPGLYFCENHKFEIMQPSY
jgi:hypothetical protein